MPAIGDTSPRPSVVWALALLPVIAAYANATLVGFMWDDHVLIEQNEAIHELHGPLAYLSSTFWQHAFLYGEGHAFYRPLVNFSFALDWQWGGGQAVAFHLTNVLLHLAVVSLVFVLALERGASTLASGVTAALFGTAPRLTESVTWVVGRTDVLATLGVLSALWCSRREGAVRWLTGPALLLGLLSKEVAVLGAFLLLAEALLRSRSQWKRELHVLGLVPLATLVFFVLRARLPSSAGLKLQPFDTFFAGLGHYTAMVFDPFHPIAQRGYVLAPEGWATALGLVATLAVCGWCAWWWRQPTRRALVPWVVTAFAGLVLVSAVVLTVFTIASDRFLYLPLAALAVVGAQLPWSRVTLAVAAGVVLACAVVTARHNEAWAEPLRFWQEVRETASPLNPGAESGLGDALFALSRFEDAQPLYELAVQKWPNRSHTPPRLSLASTHSRLGHDALALEQLDAILRDEPGWKRAAYDRVLFRARALDFAGARAALSDVRAQFGDDAVLEGFGRTLDTAQRDTQSTERSTRARALQDLGATRKAEALYLQLLEEPTARDDAMRWLMAFGTKASAERVRAMSPADVTLDALWKERFAR